MAKIIDISIAMACGTLYDSKKFTTLNNNTARRQAKAKGIKIFCATLMK
jgi:hypothetical protein